MQDSAQQYIDYVRTHKMDIQHAKAALIAVDLVFRAYVDSEKVHGVHFTPGFSYMESRTNYYQMMPDENIIAVARKVLKDFLADESSLTKMIADHKNLAKDIDGLWQSSQPLSKLSNQELLARYDQLVLLARQWWLYGVIGEDKGRIIDEDIVPVFMKNHNLTRSEATHIISILTHPEEQAVFSQERKDFFEMALKMIRSDAGLESAINIYIDKYFYKNTDFSDRKILTFESVIEDLKKEIVGNTVESLQKAISEIDGAAQRIHDDKVKIGDIQLTDEEQKLLRYTTLAVSWLDQRKEDMMKQFFYLFSLVHEMVDRINLSYEKANILSVDELREVFQGQQTITEDEYAKRCDHFVTVHETNQPLHIIYGDDARQIFELAQGIGAQGETIKGSVASRGVGDEPIIRGVVKIVVDPLEDELNDGEILVTSMTRIEFVPLMKKAKAIITNEGGIACHAAIVSRELGIPCIIGTKNATRMLANGDEVEMDVADGTIKVINN